MTISQALEKLPPSQTWSIHDLIRFFQFLDTMRCAIITRDVMEFERLVHAGGGRVKKQRDSHPSFMGSAIFNATKPIDEKWIAFMVERSKTGKPMRVIGVLTGEKNES